MSSNKFIKEFNAQETSTLMTYYRSIFNYIFPLYHLLLKHYSYSFYKELILLLYEYLNLISFIFSRPVSLYIIFKL
jgi:hypothetical protein